MENRNLSNIMGENMITPSILNSNLKTQKPVQPQPMPVQPVTPAPVQPMPTQPMPTQPMPTQTMPIQFQPMTMPMQPIQMEIQPVMPTQPMQMQIQPIMPTQPMQMQIQPIMPTQPMQLPIQPVMPTQPIQMQVQPAPTQVAGITSPVAEQPTYNAEQMREIEINIQLVYPDIYYKLQPHVLKCCQHLHSRSDMPTQDMIESLTDNIYNDVSRMYPELAEIQDTMDLGVIKPKSRSRHSCCHHKRDMDTSIEAENYNRIFNPFTDQGPYRRNYPSRFPYPVYTPFYPPYPYYTGRGGLLRDLINIMLLNEFYRGRRY